MAAGFAASGEGLPADGRAARNAAAHARWAELAADLRQACERLIATEGRESIESLSLRHNVARADPASFPVEADSARKFAAAMQAAARAVIGAELPSLKARMAPGALALAVGVEGLLADRLSEVTAGWRAHLGEGEA